MHIYIFAYIQTYIHVYVYIYIYIYIYIHEGTLRTVMESLYGGTEGGVKARKPVMITIIILMLI